MALASGLGGSHSRIRWLYVAGILKQLSELVKELQQQLHMIH